MKTPRNLTGRDLAKYLTTKGYKITRQTGSHIRLTTQDEGEHHITIPDLNPISVGTLSSILRSIAKHFDMDKTELMEEIF